MPIIYSHAGFITEGERAALRKNDWFLSITPESEMHFGHGQQTSRLVQDQASLGIDTNWTFSGDLLTQTRLWLQSVRNVSYNNILDTGKLPRQNPMSVDDAFLLATRQGARALRREDLGVLKVGAKADIACFDGTSPNMSGSTNPVAAVVLHANVGDIKHVLVGGEFRKRDGQLLLKEGDWPLFQKKFANIAKRIQHENRKPQPLPDKFFGVGEFGDVEVMSTKR
jgi:cytosine/adenosine deaminase-related metal-dependent hydrolase